MIISAAAERRSPRGACRRVGRPIGQASRGHRAAPWPRSQERNRARLVRRRPCRARRCRAAERLGRARSRARDVGEDDEAVAPLARRGRAPGSEPGDRDAVRQASGSGPARVDPGDARSGQAASTATSARPTWPAPDPERRGAARLRSTEPAAVTSGGAPGRRAASPRSGRAAAAARAPPRATTKPSVDPTRRSIGRSRARAARRGRGGPPSRSACRARAITMYSSAPPPIVPSSAPPARPASTPRPRAATSPPQRRRIADGGQRAARARRSAGRRVTRRARPTAASTRSGVGGRVERAGIVAGDRGARRPPAPRPPRCQHQRRLADRLGAADGLGSGSDRPSRRDVEDRRHGQRRAGSCRCEGAWVRSRPLASHHSSSVVSQPMPWMKPPSTWPMSIAGFSEWPQSWRMSTRATRYSPVSVSIDDLGHRGAVGEVEERPAAAAAAVPVILGVL